MKTVSAVLIAMLALVIAGGAELRAQEKPTPKPAEPKAVKAEPKAPAKVDAKADVKGDANMRGEVVTVTLQGGAKVTGVQLRKNDAGLALDLGYDVVNIPMNRVLEVHAEADDKAAPTTVGDGLYSTGRLEAAAVPELVRRHGDAVVMVRSPVGLGSGFIISKQGHVITNYHVIQGQTKLQATLFKKVGDGYEKLDLKHVKIIAFNPVRDLSLLQLDLEEIKGGLPTPVTINDRDDLGVGDLVFAVGSPLGLERTVTQGIVSSTTRTISNIRLIQTDAAINPGNSGGPLFNARGEVVGVVCAGATFFQGLAFGIPSCDLVDFLKHRDSYLYDPSQPQNGVKYLDPPYREKLAPEAAAKN